LTWINVLWCACYIFEERMQRNCGKFAPRFAAGRRANNAERPLLMPWTALHQSSQRRLMPPSYVKAYVKRQKNDTAVGNALDPGLLVQIPAGTGNGRVCGRDKIKP